MCGIAATFAYSSEAPPVDIDELLRVRDTMRHRGPDGEGMWVSDDRRTGLAHRRLSIIDLSEAGAQPMWNVERTLCIIFNGEIYNYAELRAQLVAGGYNFSSHCDTEVLLQLYADKGEAMLDDLRGMYAFAIWDARQRMLFMARDPFGIKPLYYADDGRSIRIASQVKALVASGKISRTPDPAAHVGFFVWGSVPDPFTLYREVQALPAGHSLTVKENGKPQLRRFCFIPEILRECQAAGMKTTSSTQEQHELLRSALHGSAIAHLVADVPVGVFLSAGLDSSTITALISETHPDVRTVTLGFEDFRGTESDETRLAEVVARQYGTKHETIWINRRDFEADAARLFETMDRPSVDGVNTYFVSLAARRAGLKVALSGLGGDELFGGYPSFIDVPRTVRWMNRVPVPAALAREFRVISAPVLKRFTSPKYAGVFEYGSSYPGAYLLRRSLFMPWELPSLLDADLVREGWQRLHTLSALGTLVDGLCSPRAKVSALELCWYMRHQLLRDSDWAGMGHSLEIRVPFVDVTLLRQIAPLLTSEQPPTKHDMALSPTKRLPLEVLSRPKTGFTVPIRDWLLQSFDPTPGRERGLRGWAREVYSRFGDTAAVHRLKLRQHKLRKLRGSERLHALVLVSDAYGSVGGIAKFNRDFLKALSTSDRIENVTVLPRIMPLAPEIAPAKVHVVPEALGGKLQYLRAVRTAARSLRSEAPGRVLIFCGHINLMPAAAMAKHICRGTLHLIIHGIDAWSPIRDPAIRASLRTLDGFVAVSRITKLRFQHWSRLRADDGMILPNSVDLSRFTPGPKAPHLVERYDLLGRNVLMTFGRLESAERYKGFDQILDVLPQLGREFRQLTYLVCGDGPDRARLVTKARSLGCAVAEIPNGESLRNFAANGAPRVVFTGRIAEDEKVDHYRLADLYVMPSYGEGFGIVFLEALACGVPVIGSKADGSRDALRDGLLGTLVDPRDPDDIYRAIVGALAHGRNGAPPLDRDALACFSSERYTQRVHEIIDTIAAAA